MPLKWAHKRSINAGDCKGTILLPLLHMAPERGTSPSPGVACARGVTSAIPEGAAKEPLHGGIGRGRAQGERHQSEFERRSDCAFPSGRKQSSICDGPGEVVHPSLWHAENACFWVGRVIYTKTMFKTAQKQLNCLAQQNFCTSGRRPLLCSHETIAMLSAHAVL